VALCGLSLLYTYSQYVRPPTFDDRDIVVYCDNNLCKAASFVWHWDGSDLEPYVCPFCGQKTLFRAFECSDCGAVYGGPGDRPGCPTPDCPNADPLPIDPKELDSIPPELRQKWLDPLMKEGLKQQPELIQGGPDMPEKATEWRAPEDRKLAPILDDY
jgi:hypothetical protein